MQKYISIQGHADADGQNICKSMSLLGTKKYHKKCRYLANSYKDRLLVKEKKVGLSVKLDSLRKCKRLCQFDAGN
jgi:hypothetical protein